MKLAYTINEAVAEIGIGRTKLYQEIAAGKLELKKIGQRSVILNEELHRYLNSLPEAPLRKPMKDMSVSREPRADLKKLFS